LRHHDPQPLETAQQITKEARCVSSKPVNQTTNLKFAPTTPNNYIIPFLPQSKRVILNQDICALARATFVPTILTTLPSQHHESTTKKSSRRAFFSFLSLSFRHQKAPWERPGSIPILRVNRRKDKGTPVGGIAKARRSYCRQKKSVCQNVGRLPDELASRLPLVAVGLVKNERGNVLDVILRKTSSKGGHGVLSVGDLVDDLVE